MGAGSSKPKGLFDLAPAVNHLIIKQRHHLMGPGSRGRGARLGPSRARGEVWGLLGLPRASNAMWAHKVRPSSYYCIRCQFWFKASHHPTPATTPRIV